MPPLRKLAVQLVAAGIVVGSNLLITRFTLIWARRLSWQFSFAFPFTMSCIAALHQCVHLMDGLDGLAGGLVVIAASTCAIVLIARGEQPAAHAVVLVGATAGFRPQAPSIPVCIFLGDSGSMLAGFLLAVTAIIGRQKGATTLATAVPRLIFALPLTDTILSVVRRLVRRPGGAERFFEHALVRVFSADREHLHHRLLATGLSQRGVVLVLYGLAAACSEARSC